MFSIPIDDEVIGEEDYEKAYVRDIRKLGVLSNRYTIREYNQTLLDIRKSGDISLDAVTSACIKMIATKKQLYD